jgi:hypothetical protein
VGFASEFFLSSHTDYRAMVFEHQRRQKLKDEEANKSRDIASQDRQSGDVLLDEHKRLEGKTKTALMQTTAKAATHAAQKPPLDVSNTSQLRDLAQSAARIFGWGEGGMTVNANQALIVTQEQLEQIRQLRDDPFAKPAISEGDAISAITTEESKR